MHAQIRWERAWPAELHGGCTAPVGAMSEVLPDGSLALLRQVTLLDGNQSSRGAGRGRLTIPKPWAGPSRRSSWPEVPGRSSGRPEWSPKPGNGHRRKPSAQPSFLGGETATSRPRGGAGHPGPIGTAASFVHGRASRSGSEGAGPGPPTPRP
ncbi:hypothetical protein ACIA8H_22305 [Streptomyces goshikiensis]|uniref:hypothetical protein n=1 Tax=Streptomyces goshikiensis TaxID=1942 RepID=UPI00378D265A